MLKELRKIIKSDDDKKCEFYHLTHTVVICKFILYITTPLRRIYGAELFFYLYGVGLFLPPVRFGTYPATIFVFYGATLGHILDEILCREICKYYKLKCE